MNRTGETTVWGKIYNILNIAVIILILIRLFTDMNFNMIIVCSFAALLVLGLLDSLDRNAWRENMFRHLFDLILLILFSTLYFG
ncbi:hypothetical protein [Macrococcoides caseolyticum]|uniref:hypothetical protein n=1 Tax=Macrococcoides caseolyticum TaxID=69966 RepID=UPI001F367395|nr:hypothetical protein [Macrococcus caseolyticus]MCE4957780.1 hypothetical protein [Macrococcus caseolyticus]